MPLVPILNALLDEKCHPFLGLLQKRFHVVCTAVVKKPLKAHFTRMTLVSNAENLWEKKRQIVNECKRLTNVFFHGDDES